MVIKLLLAFRRWLLWFRGFAWRDGTRFDALLLHSPQTIIECAQSGGKILTQVLIALTNLLQQRDDFVHVLVGFRRWGVAILTGEIALFAERTRVAFVAFLLSLTALLTCLSCTHLLLSLNVKVHR